VPAGWRSGKGATTAPKTSAGHARNGTVAPSNASSRVTELAYGKYWRRELPGLEPVRQWKIGRACARDWRRELPGLKPFRQRKMRTLPARASHLAHGAGNKLRPKVWAPTAGEVCYSSLPLAGRRVVQAVARGDTKAVPPSAGRPNYRSKVRTLASVPRQGSIDLGVSKGRGLGAACGTAEAKACEMTVDFSTR
jgi:hypothetical protein